jgi:hypothetical protein
LISARDWINSSSLSRNGRSGCSSRCKISGWSDWVYLPFHFENLCLPDFLYSEDLGVHPYYIRPYCCGNGSVPGFESSLYNWVSKFININLYTLWLIPSSILGSSWSLPAIWWK